MKLNEVINVTKSKDERKKSLNFPSKVLYENRYCNQDDFSILVCGGKYINNAVENSVYKLDGHELSCEKYTCMQKKLCFSENAVVN